MTQVRSALPTKFARAYLKIEILQVGMGVDPQSFLFFWRVNVLTSLRVPACAAGACLSPNPDGAGRRILLATPYEPIYRTLSAARLRDALTGWPSANKIGHFLR